MNGYRIITTVQLDDKQPAGYTIDVSFVDLDGKALFGEWRKEMKFPPAIAPQANRLKLGCVKALEAAIDTLCGLGFTRARIGFKPWENT